MKQIFSLTLIFSLYIFTANGQGFFAKQKIKRIALLVNESKIANALEIRNKIQVSNNWSARYLFFFDYPNHRLLVDSINNNIESYSLGSLLQKQTKIHKILSNWEKLKRDTIFLARRGYKIDPLRSAKQRIDKLIDYKQSDQGIIDSLSKQIIYKKDYETPAILDSLANVILPQILSAEIVPPLQGSKSTEYLLEVIKDGKNLIVKLQLYYEENLYGYPLGSYQSPAIDYPIKIFSRIVLGRLQPKNLVKVDIIGEADANRPNGLTYNGKDLGNINQDGFQIKYGDLIDNEDLAFLRAYNAQLIFFQLVNKPVNQLRTKDHLKISDQNLGLQYRKVTMTASFFGYFTEEYNKLSDDAKRSLDDHKQTIIIKNNKIIY